MATSQHVCNAWCIDEVHAIFFDTMVSERGGLQQTAERLAANARLRYIGHSEIRGPVPASRGRVVIWCGA